MKTYLTSPLWHTIDGVSVRGFVVVDGRMLCGDDMARYFAEAARVDILHWKLETSDGLFAVVVVRERWCAIAVDRVRSIPLFYSPDGIADTPYPLAPPPFVLDKASAMAYKASAATFPGCTLDCRVSQVEAGTLVVLAPQMQHIPYYSHLCRTSEERPSTVSALSEAMDVAFSNLSLTLPNGPVVVPLSGGYDSRLIACHLKKMGVGNVVCFNAGVPGSSEEAVARRVAETLGFDYHFVDTTSPDVFSPSIFESEDFHRYYRHLGGYTNFVWLFEYVAIRYLLQRGVVSQDAVVVPGHSADSLAGSHIAKGGINIHSTAHQLARAMVYRSFEYKASFSLYKCVKDYCEWRLNDGYTPVSIYQDIILQHRQAQQIVNSARVYEHFGLGLRLPFWDNALLRFFRTLPYSQLYACRLYEQYAHEIFQEFGVDFPRADAKAVAPASYFRLWLKHHLPNAVVSRLSHAANATGEDIMVQPLIDGLRRAGVYSKHHHPLTSNEVLRDWYLHRCLTDC
ncbi:MAG: hypothetical protein II793_00030 [Bacteroidales bacterium]|nr:hypothetical protein [Bacteroidales bacterium]